MSLARALSRLPADERHERVLRDVLALFRKHKSEWLSESDVAVKTGQPRSDIHDTLPVLVAAYVLDADADGESYRFRGDVALSYEIDAFMQRVESHKQHKESNIAKYRERYGA